MLSGSSGETGPIGDQLFVKRSEMESDVLADDGMEKRREKEFASCGWRVVAVSLSLKAP